jgi:hypothetical protein
MPDTSKSSGGPPKPSFYSAAAGMAQQQGAGAGEPKPGTGAGQQGEKVKNIQVLLEVFEKMDKLEQDDTNKKLIQEMVDKAKEYLSKLEGGAAAKKGPAPVAATGEAGSGGMGGGAGAVSPGVGAPEMAGA